MKSEYHFETGKSNTIAVMSLDFYESIELENYINKILNIKPKKKVKK